MLLQFKFVTNKNNFNMDNIQYGLLTLTFKIREKKLINS